MQTNALATFDVQNGELSGNTTIDCLTLVERYGQEMYNIPVFQRQALLWPQAQRQSFINRIRIGPAPIGAIVIFVSRDDPARSVYILDGLQRISTMWEFYHAPEIYGVDDLATARLLLHQTEFPLQRRTYKDKWDAYADFVRLQKSLTLTSYEENLGKRSLLASWDWFGSTEARLHDFMAKVISGYQVKEGEDRKNAHNYLRNNLGMWLRFMTAEKRLEPWNVIGTKNPVEDSLSEQLNGQITMSMAETFWPKFRNRIDLDFGVISQAWTEAKQELDLPEARRMEITVIRFLHECGIFSSINDMSRLRFFNFSKQLLLAGEGRGQIPIPNTADRITLGLGRLGRIGGLIRRTEITEDIRNSDDKYDKTNGNYPIGRGQDRGHLQPKSLFGQGPTAPEPASLNRAKGNRG